MLLALFLASGSALLGGALALAVRRRRALLELTRTFAFAAAAGVVCLHLLPEALEAIGARGLAWAAVGFALPGLLERYARKLAPGLRARGLSSARVSAEVGFLALEVHSLLEGVALSAAAKASGSHLDLEVALVAHHAPLTAAVILPFIELVGPWGVFFRVLAIALAGATGAVSGGLAPGAFSSGNAQDIASAIMAGALLHVVSDEIRAQRFDAVWERAADFFAAIAGVAIALVSAAFEGGLANPFVAGLIALALPCAPALLAADLLAALPLPSRFRTRALAPRPELDALFVSARALGLLAALVQLLISLGGQALSAAFAPGEARPEEIRDGFFDRLLANAQQRGPRRLVTLLLGGLFLWLLRNAGDPGSTPLAFQFPLLATAFAALAFLCLAAISASAAAFIAAVFLDLNFPWQPGPALLVPVLAVGPLLLRRTAWRGGCKRRFTGALLILLFGASAAVLLTRGPFVDRTRELALSLLSDPAKPLLARLSASPLESASAAIVVILSLASLWRAGARGWFAELRHREDGEK